MQTRLNWLAIGLCAVTWTSTAAAQPTVKGLTLGVERVFGFVAASSTTETDNLTVRDSVSGISLGSAALSSSSIQPFYTIPRVGLDYLLDSGLSFGGAFGIGSMGAETERETGAVTVTTRADATTFLFAPRVGYLIGLNEQFGIWPRGGFTYVTNSFEVGDDDASIAFGALTIEAPLVFTPTKAYGFVATPALDLGVAGSQEANGDEFDGDMSLTEFGLTLGLFVVL